MKSLAIKIKKRFSINNGSQPRMSGLRNSVPKSSADGSDLRLSDSGDKDDLFANKVKYQKEDLLEPVPSFRELPPEKSRSLFIKKLRLCSVIFDFQRESPKENVGKEMKRQILLELVDYITTHKGWFSYEILKEILAMVSANLFRCLSPSIHCAYDPEEDEPALDPCWPHLQLVYEFLLRFVVSTEPDPKQLKRKLNGPFLLQVLETFHSEDPREREYLKTILHRIYGKFMGLRSFIRRSVNNVFFRVIYENEKHNGIGELLEIFGSIINGFALPLKVEHKKFLRNVLIPLHKVSRLQIFHQQLSYCVTQFIDKDSSLSTVIIGGILKFWPLTSSSKEVLLLNELEEVLEVTPNHLLRSFIRPIFQRLAKCIENQHFQVAERALFFWNNDFIGNLTTSCKDEIFPIVVPSLYHIQKKHWNTTVHSLTANVVKMMQEMDSDLYSKISEEADALLQVSNDRNKLRIAKWNHIRQMVGNQNQQSSTIEVWQPN